MNPSSPFDVGVPGSAPAGEIMLFQVGKLLRAAWSARPYLNGVDSIPGY